MRRRLAVLVPLALLALGGVALAFGGGGDPPPRVPLATCVDVWNKSGDGHAAGRTVASSGLYGAVVTHDDEGRCVVALDGSRCGGPKDIAMAWVRRDGRWRRLGHGEAVE